ncbi:retrovirus-related pol polyprotein from transposon TNT 1-94 [Tanacetum coccineum]
MAQRKQAADVHLDELCPPNKRYDLMVANKKVDLENVQCPSESKILMNIITNHPLRFSIAASSSVPWIYMAQKELTLTLDDFRTIFHLPQANDNNHASFVPPPSFSDMTLCKIFSKCLTTRVTGWDQPPLQIMQMLYCFVNNIHVDYAKLMWEGIYYSLHHPATLIPYPRFTKIIISHYMTIFPDISRRARDAYHNLQYDDIMKNIFNSGRNKNKVGMRIPPWMITKEMRLTEHYKMYAEVFGLDVPLIQQFARLTPPAPVPTTEKADEMILQDMIQVSLAEQKSREEQEARENVALVDEHLAAEEIEKLVEESTNVDDSSPLRHDDTSIPGTRLEPESDKESPEVEIVQEKEEETTKDMEVEPNIVIPVNVDDEEDEITNEVFELRRRAKGKNVEESRISPIPSPTRSPRNLSTLGSSDTEKLQELTVTHPTPSSGSFVPKLTKTNHLLSLIKAKPNPFKRYKSFFHELQGRYGYLFAHLKKTFMPRKSSDQLADNLHDVMVETLPSLVKENVTEQVKKEVPTQVRDQLPVYLAKGMIQERKTTKEEMERLISKAILQEQLAYTDNIYITVKNIRKFMTLLFRIHERSHHKFKAVKDILEAPALSSDHQGPLVEGVTPSVVDMMVEKEKISSLDDTIIPESFPTFTMSDTTTVGNAPGKSTYANITGKPSRKKVNVRTLFTPRGNRIDVVVPVDSIRAFSERFANTAYGFFLGKKVAYPVVANYNNSLILKKWHPNENLLKEDVSTVPVWVKLHGVPVTPFRKDSLSAIASKLGIPLMLDSYTSDKCMQSWGRSSYVRVMIELRADVELKDNIVVAMPKITTEGHYIYNVRVEYDWKPLRLKVGFKPHKEYRHVPKKSTTSSSSNKKKGEEPTIEATSSGSSFTNVDNSSSGTTPIIEKTGKFKDLITSGQVILVDKDDNPLKKVEFLGEYDSEDEVASVDNDMARSMAYERGFGTQSLLEQWKDSYGNGNYDDDPYDNDMYEGQDLSHEL